MAFGKKKDKDELTSGSLSAEFFGDGSGATAAPGAKEAEDTGTDLLHAVTGAAQSSAAPGQDKASEGESYSLFNTAKTPVDLGPDYSKKSWFQLGTDDNAALNPYAAEQDKRYGMDPRAAKIVRLVVLIVVAFVLCAIVLPNPTYNMNFAYTFSAFITCIQDNVFQLTSLFGYTPGNVMPYKICTYAIVLLAGAGLAITGAVYQGALKNALVSPTTLGVNSGATMGVTIFVLFASDAMLDPIFGGEAGYASVQSTIAFYDSLSIPDYLLYTSGTAIAGVIGSFVAVALVMTVSHLMGKGKSSGYALIICGMVVASVASSVVECVRYYLNECGSDAKVTAIKNMQIGAIDPMSTWIDLLMVAVPVIVGLVIVILLRNKLNVLAFNDEEARSMGIATQRLRWVMVLVCTLITGVIISFCGNIAFVGFAIPLIVRRYVGPNFNYLIPASAAMGAVYMVCLQWITDLDIFMMFNIDIPMSVSMLSSFIGAVLFAVITLKQRGAGRSADWI